MILRILLGFVALALLLYLGFLLLLTLTQRRILFTPNTATPDAAAAGVVGLEALHVSTDDGLSLLAWYVPPPRQDGCMVLYLHGNGGNIAGREGRIRAFAAAGWGTLLQEYRGYGGNPGSPSEAGLISDARAGLDLLVRRGTPPERILIWGESLGSGLAVRLATERQVAALLLESPYTSIAAIAAARYPFVPVDLLLRDRFDSLSRIPRVTVPVLVMQGGRDTLVPPWMGRTLFAAATAPKQLWTSPEANHLNLAEHGAINVAIDFVHAHGLCR